MLLKKELVRYFDNTSNKAALKKVACSIPFNSFHIFHEGFVTNCCFYWMPTVMGNITEKSLLEIMQDERSMHAKKSVTDGSYSFCDSKICPSLVTYLNEGKIDVPLMPIDELNKFNQKQVILFLDYDLSCNLFCGSCRNERILHSLDDAPSSVKLVHQSLMKQVRELLDADYEIILQVTSTGDPFASPFYWQYLKSIEATEKYKVRLTTNGTLMTRDRLLHPYAQKIDHIEVSVDAFTEETYNKVRRGGNFKALRQNLKNLDEMITRRELNLLRFWKVNFVVQADNYREMVDFVKWAIEFENLNKIWFLLIYDWGHLEKSQFNAKAVWHEDHPEYNQFLEVLKDPIFDDPRVFIGNLAALRARALEKDSPLPPPAKA